MRIYLAPYPSTKEPDNDKGMEFIQGSYYRINNTKKILYWDGEKWMKPVKDQQKRYGSYVVNLEKQPKVKTAEIIKVSDIPY